MSTQPSHLGATLWRSLLTMLLILGLSLASPLARAQAVQPVPELTARVIDRTGTLQAAEIANLDARLAALEVEKGSQVVVLMVPSTQPEDIFSYSNRVANAWKIGRAQVGDGLLIVVAKDDRRMRIEVAKTLEGAVTDIQSGRIINEAMAPRFRAGDYAGGIEAAVDAVSALIRNEPLPLPEQAPAQNTLDDVLPFVFFAVFVGMQVLRRFAGGAVVAAIVGVGTGLFVGWVTQSVLWGIVAGVAAAFMGLFSRVPVSSGSGGSWGGGSGGWSSGRGGGGFSSGGGGSFGGGGASGRW